MNIAICDDEKHFRSVIEKYINDYNCNYDIFLFENGKSLLDSGVNFDIIFLDISMPGYSGLDTAELLRKHGSKAIIIFLTSYSEYVYDAFKVDTFRFLKKPIEKSCFDEAITEAENKIKSEYKISIRHLGEVNEVFVSDIVYFEGYGDGTYVYTSDGTVLDSGISLKSWTEKMESFGYFRINRNFLISVDKIKKFSGNELILCGTNEKFVVSRRNVSKFKEFYFEYIKSHAHHI